MVTVYLALGSNLGDRAALLDAAVSALAGRGILRDPLLSPVYETEAVSVEPQPPYLNAVVRGQTDLEPALLLGGCLEVEAELGRVRPANRAKAPRTMDIDLLLYGDRVIESVALEVPHPAMLGRPFVLIPLADVAAPGLVHPVTRRALTWAPPSAGVRAV